MQKGGTICAIGRDDSDGSCFTLKELHSIASDYNKKNSKEKIKLLDSKEEMVNELTKLLIDDLDKDKIIKYLNKINKKQHKTK
jgi:hypothetical protein